MKRNDTPSVVSDVTCFVLAGVFLLGFLVLALRLREVQVVDSAAYSYNNDRQSIRRVQTPGTRGLLLDRNGEVLAANRTSVAIVVNAEHFQQRTWAATDNAISNEIERLAAVLGARNPLAQRDLKRHVRQTLAMPLVVWSDVGHVMLARFLEHERDFPGFGCIETEERFYPGGRLAAHLIGYVGRDRADAEAGDTRFNFRERELSGRSGVEAYYNAFLRGVPGERRLRVDARGFATDEWTVEKARRGLDLTLSLDSRLQRSVERQLEGLRGACVALDPRNGEVLAFASAPAFDLNEFVPRLPEAVYAKYSEDCDKPLLNRASGGAYAPGSTFKPVTALAGLSIGFPADFLYCCSGLFELGQMKLHCARRWGHGELDMRNALKESCNPYFCNLGLDIGTNAVIAAARAFGLGAKTGIDLPVDMAGTVPDAEWKMKMYREKWFQGDLAQMSIGQGMLLVSPLQMARVAGAIGTGYLVTPRVRLGMEPERVRLPFTAEQLSIVRDGMRMVVAEGTGKRGGEGVPVAVSGKTGTAEVGRADNRRKNTWFIAYAPSDDPEIAVAMVIENGQSGGGTTAPKVAAVLRDWFAARKGGE